MGGMGLGTASGNDPYRRGMAPGMMPQQQPAPATTQPTRSTTARWI